MSENKGTTQIGFTNLNLQTVIGFTHLDGTDFQQKLYPLRCGHCGHVYVANGSDIFERRCPACGVKGLGGESKQEQRKNDK